MFSASFLTRNQGRFILLLVMLSTSVCVGQLYLGEEEVVHVGSELSSAEAVNVFNTDVTGTSRLIFNGKTPQQLLSHQTIALPNVRIASLSQFTWRASVHINGVLEVETPYLEMLALVTLKGQPKVNPNSIISHAEFIINTSQYKPLQAPVQNSPMSLKVFTTAEEFSYASALTTQVESKKAASFTYQDLKVNLLAIAIPTPPPES